MEDRIDRMNRITGLPDNYLRQCSEGGSGAGEMPAEFEGVAGAAWSDPGRSGLSGMGEPGCGAQSKSNQIQLNPTWNFRGISGGMGVLRELSFCETNPFGGEPSGRGE